MTASADPSSPADPTAAVDEVRRRVGQREGAAPPEPRTHEHRLGALRRQLGELRLQAGAFGAELPAGSGLWRRVLRKLLRWYSAPQARFNAQLTRTLDDLAAEIDRLSSELARRDARATPEGETSGTGRWYTRAVREAITPDPAAIREAWACLAAHLTGAGPVAVCGAPGPALLDALEEGGVGCYAVEPDPELAAALRAQGHTVHPEPLLAHLGGLAPGSLDGAVLFGSCERTDVDGADRLLRETASRLSAGARVAVVCANPYAPAAMARFHADPGRVRPVDPELLALLGRGAGLTCRAALFSHPPLTELSAPPADPTAVEGHHAYALVLQKL